MAKFPAWIIQERMYVKDGQAWIVVRLRTRHPSFWLVLWRAMKRSAQKRGYSPYHPLVLWAFVKMLASLVIKGGAKHGRKSA